MSEDRVIVVTGASSGLGAEVAEHFALRGFRVAPFLEMTDDQWGGGVSAHLRGHFVCCQEYLFHNPDRPGAIVTLGAACGQIGRKNGANFALHFVVDRTPPAVQPPPGSG